MFRRQIFSQYLRIQRGLNVGLWMFILKTFEGLLSFDKRRKSFSLTLRKTFNKYEGPKNKLLNENLCII